MIDFLLERFPDADINRRILFCIGLKAFIHAALMVAVI